MSDWKAKLPKVLPDKARDGGALTRAASTPTAGESSAGNCRMKNTEANVNRTRIK